jgi:predicted Zn-ribbon and HTH transcriptional regulator
VSDPESIERQKSIRLAEHRCYNCGRWYAFESRGPHRCPSCAGDRIAELEAEAMKNERAMASLRGAITKAKKR